MTDRKAIDLSYYRLRIISLLYMKLVDNSTNIRNKQVADYRYLEVWKSN